MRLPAVALALMLPLLPTAHAQEQSFDVIERGRYVATAADCAACHTLPGAKPYAGGVRLETPFGPIIAPNITPDPETGIGRYTSQDFEKAVRKGIGKGGRRLYPAMPYTAYTRMSDQDLEALWTYFGTVEPVHNAIEANQLPFPFNQRLLMAGWNWLNFSPGRMKSDPGRSDDWNRGAYLVEALGHCGACHTPKTWSGADRTDLAFQGATLQGWTAPDITGDKHKGLGGWSERDVVEYLKTGGNQKTLASGPMAEEIRNSSSKMSDGDLAAIATYLKDVPNSNAEAVRTSAADANMKAGEAIYVDRCAACHGMSGLGTAGLFPTLRGSGVVQTQDASTLTRLVLDGSQAIATREKPTGPAMPSFAWLLSDRQVADVLNYIRNAWGNAAPSVTPRDVHRARAGSPD